MEPAPPKPALPNILSLILLLFLGHAVVSFLDRAFLLVAQRADLSVLDGVLSLLMMGTGFLTYDLMAFNPSIPKRFFLPVSLYLPVASVAVLPLLVYFYEQANLIGLMAAVGELLVGLAVLRGVQGRWLPRWPLCPAWQLREKGFSFGNLLGVVLLGTCLILPAMALYTVFAGALALDHFTDGFMTVQPSGLTMEMRKYVRGDGKEITLVPMMHVGEPEFYRDVGASFPADSVVLMEGVTDQANAADEPLDYSGLAGALGLVGQVANFRPRGRIVAADVDISSFSPTTLDILKRVALFHEKGVNAQTLPLLLKPTSPEVQRQLVEDLLIKRNRHLLEVLAQRLPQSRDLIVPWGVAHLPGIAREIQKAGFRMVESKQYLVIRSGW